LQTALKLLICTQNPDYLEFEGSLATVKNVGLVWPSLIIERVHTVHIQLITPPMRNVRAL